MPMQHVVLTPSYVNMYQKANGSFVSGDCTLMKHSYEYYIPTSANTDPTQCSYKKHLVKSDKSEIGEKVGIMYEMRPVQLHAIKIEGCLT